MVELDPSGGPPTLAPGTFRIDRDGAWRHEGQEVTHPGVVQSLYANLRVEGAEHFLQVGPRRIPVEVEDAPFVVSRLEIVGGSPAEPPRVRLYLSDGATEWLEPQSLHLGARGTPYCRVKAGRFAARLSVAAWLQLAPALEEGPEPGQVALVLGGRRLPVPTRA